MKLRLNAMTYHPAWGGIRRWRQQRLWSSRADPACVAGLPNRWTSVPSPGPCASPEIVLLHLVFKQGWNRSCLPSLSSSGLILRIPVGGAHACLALPPLAGCCARTSTQGVRARKRRPPQTAPEDENGLICWSLMAVSGLTAAIRHQVADPGTTAARLSTLPSLARCVLHCVHPSALS